MRKDKTSARKFNRILTICMSIVLLAAIILSVVAITYNPSTSDKEFDATKGTYSSNQAQITNPNTTTSTETITMTAAYANKSSIGSKIITIANEDELIKFSSACNSDTDYLAKSYKLISNIKCSDGSSAEFVPVGFKGTPFSGTFDGNNYEISNLKMVEITPQKGNESTYASMQYYAMFSVNTGTIKNLGLVEFKNAIVTVELDNIITNGGVATLVGKNEGSGKVQYCYLRDLRDMIDDQIGLAVYGAYRIAGLVYHNAATFNNCYVAASTVANYKINGYESICSICYKDENYNASTSNLYYYDGSIDSFKSVSGTREITYVDEIFEDATFLDDSLNVGVYCPNSKLNEAEGLNTHYTGTTGVGAGWYLPSKYDSGLTDYIKNETPIRRGLSYVKGEGTNPTYTFDINNTDDFLYMYELMNHSDFFAGDKAIYKITADINLINIEPENYHYGNILMCTITSNQTGGSIKPTLVTNSTSNYPTIYNFNAISSKRKVTTLGIDSYGLFPFVGGTISYLNIIPDAFDMKNVDTTNNTNVKGISAVSGYVEKGRITNVNTYVTVTHSSTDIKEYYLGGICAILGGEGTVDNCTAGGSYNISRFTSAAVSSSSYTVGNAIGGVVGYINSDYGSIKTCLSGVNIDFNANSGDVMYQIGGVVGAAYTIEAEELENVGYINIGSGTATSGGTDGSRVVFGKMYVAGVIGRHLGVKNQVKNFTNQGDIKASCYSDDKELYVAGIENADILTAKVNNTGLIASTDKTKDGKFRFRASSLTNRADITTVSNRTYSSIEITSGINVMAKNGFVTELSGVYNLNYKELYNSSATKTKSTLGAYTIYVNNLFKYSGVVNVLNGATPNENYTTSLNTVYNLRDTTITTYNTVSTTELKYFGTVRGKYINYNDVRNEGSTTFTTTKTISSNIIIAGVFEEVSEKCSADNIYNGGDISLTYSGISITGDVKISGICYKNSGYDASTITKYNPSSNDFDSKAKGAMNNVINNGSITVDNPTEFDDITYNYARVSSPNGMSYLGSFSYTNDWSSAHNITGNIFTTGITTYNEAPITNTFNLGDIFAANYIKDSTTEREINAAGIAGLNIGKYAYILNSANNGNIKAINLSTATSINVGTQNQVKNAILSYTDYLSNVNAAGIIARNDELEDGSIYTSNTTNSNSNQIVSFTINYGDIYSYNYRTNIQSTSAEPKAKSAGIVAMGLLNTINVMNYGNIYGSETASGIFGVMYFSRFQDEVTASNKVNIANTINYGNVYMLSKGYNNAHGDTYPDYKVITYTKFKQFDNDTNKVKTQASKNGDLEAFTEVSRNANFISSIGSIFALANYATSDSSKNIVIRYLISFNSACSIVGATVSAPTGITVDTATLYSAHISTNAATGAYQNDNWINGYVQYSPLSTGSVSGSFVTNIDSATGTVSKENKTYYGIFNSNFEFSKAILGKTTLDTTTHPTDAYLTDFFQFVGFQYINPILFEKIGWQTMAYSTAANDFTTNVNNVIKVLEKSNNFISTVSSAAKTPFKWMKDSTAEDLSDLIDYLAAEEQYSDLKSVLEYLYSDDSQSNIFITSTLRTNVLSKLISNEQLLPYLTGVLQYNNSYSATLAKSIVIEEDEVKGLIDRYVEDLDSASLVGIYDSYISYLESNNNSYFSYGNNENRRIDTLTTLFSSVDDVSFYRELVSMLGITDSTLTDSAKMLAGYNTLNTASKSTLFKNIIKNNSLTNISTYLETMASDIDYYKELVSRGLNISSLEELYAKAGLYSGLSNDTSASIINERINLWNLIRNTDVFATNFTYANYGVPTTTYYKATEYNNTYQSVTEPHNGGAYVGDTNENRLSYYYTKDITPAVYFYGPYSSATSTTLSLKSDDGTQGDNYNTVKKDGNFYTRPQDMKTNVKDLNNTLSRYYSLFHYTDDALWSSNEYMKSRGGANSTTRYSDIFQVSGDLRDAVENYTDTFPQLIFYDFNNEQLGGANYKFTLSGNYYTAGTGSTLSSGSIFWGFNGSQCGTNKSFPDPITGEYCNASDWSGTILSSNDYYMYVSSTGERFSLNNATMGPRLSSGGNKTVTLSNGNKTIYNNRFYIQDSDGVNHPVQASGNDVIQIGKMVNGTFVAEHTLKNFYTNNNNQYQRQIYSFIAYYFGLRMWTSTVCSNLHTTARTGIYRRRSGNADNFSNYFTWKQSEGVHVYTSQFIDYKYSDLLNLDGVLTEYDGKTYSNDEREIINGLFNDYFLKSNKYVNFRNLVRAALLEALGTNVKDDNGVMQTNGDLYIDNFLVTNIYSTTTISSSIPFAYLYESSGTTVQAYLAGLQSFTADNKKLLIYGSSSNQQKYIALLKELRTITAIGADANYANYVNLLSYLATHPGAISGDTVSLANLSSMSLTDLQTYLSCFDNNGEVNITNLYAMSSGMSSYSGSTVYNQATYDATTYNYGLKFTSMTLTPASTDTRVIMVAKSTGASSTLTSGTQSTTVTTINEYNLLTNGATSFTVTSNNDVIVYAIKFIKDAAVNNQTTTLTGTVLGAANSGTSFTVTRAEIEAQINTAIQNTIGNTAYYRVTSYSTVANMSVYNNNGTQANMYLAPQRRAAKGTEYSNTTFTVNRYTTYTYNLTMQDSYYGSYFYPVMDYNTNEYSFNTARYLTAISYTITYSYLSSVAYRNSTTNVNSATYTPNSYAMTAPTEDNVKQVVLNDAGLSTWSSGLTINSVNMTLNVRNGGTRYYYYLYDGTTDERVQDLGRINANATTTVSSVDLTQRYGHTLALIYSSNGYNNWNYASDTIAVITNYSYTVNYTINGNFEISPNKIISNDDIYKDRLLNLSLPNYSTIRNRYLAQIYNTSTNATTKYNTFVKTNVTNFTPINTSGNANSPTNPFVDQLTDAKKIELANTIIVNNNAALYYMISQLCDNNEKLSVVLKEMAKGTSGYSFIADSINKLANTSSGGTNLVDKYPNLLKALVATYIVADFRNIISIGGTINNTIYATLVTNVDANASGTDSNNVSYNGNIDYINSSTGAIDSTKYNRFVEYILGTVTATNSYGIFALASSRGIQNGAFIPDNVDLVKMDVYYDTTAKLNNVSYIELTDTLNPSWRDNLGTSTSTIYTTTDHSSVNYHVRVEMKQLVKAISNVIFELDLECNDTVLYSSEKQIDYADKIITYYVSETYLSYINTASQLKIKELLIADTALANKAVGDYVTLTNKKTNEYKLKALTSDTFVANKYYVLNGTNYTLASTYDSEAKYYELSSIVVADAITITPEEAAYTAIYKIKFIKIDTTIDSYAFNRMDYETSEGSGEFTYATTARAIPYYGAKVTFKVTAPNLPDGMDLSSFFTVTNQLKNVTWEFDPDTDDNCIVKNGVAYIVINVDISMSMGSKAFVLNIYGSNNRINLTKNGNTKAEITSFGYDGLDRASTMNSSKTISSEILFGRAFNYNDLTKPYILTTDTAVNEDKVYYTQNGSSDYYSYTKVTNPVDEDIATYYEANEDFYLYSFGISSNATVKITATKTADTVRLMTYTVTYSVKPESGSAVEYTHTLTEMDYFTTNEQGVYPTYGYLYKDGVQVSDSELYKTDFDYNGVEMPATDCSNLTYNASAADNFVAVTFNRGSEPQYRIKYVLSNFYGDQTKYTVAEGEANSATTSPQNTYAGISITLDDEKEPGVYKYVYIYTNTGEWTSEGSWVPATVFNPNIEYYIDLGDGTHMSYFDATGEVLTEEAFEMYKDYLVVYETGDSSYTRTYTFPALYIYKDFSTDALFHKLTFLDESIVLGGTASVMLATTPISAATEAAVEAGTAHVDSDAQLYEQTFDDAASNNIRIEPNKIVYTNDSDAASVTDYYTVGTVSDTDLENYSPSVTLEEHAQIFKYTTLTKLTKYGADNHQDTAKNGSAYKDSEILSTRSDMLLYVPFVTGTGNDTNYEVFLVLLNSSMQWTKVFTKDFKGTDLTQSIKTYDTPFTTKEAEATPTLTEFVYDNATYRIADYAGDTNITSEEGKNISLYMDFVGDPLEDHFWYISYVVFSEYYLAKGTVDKNNDGVDDNGAVRYYHISIVDASNTVYFDVSLYAPENFKLDEIYLTFAENTYEKQPPYTYIGSTQLSCYLEKQYDDQNHLIYGAAQTKEAGLVLYKLKLSIAALPPGYFSFYLDLPNGYGAECYTNKDNEIDKTKEPGLSNQDAYLPHTTIIPITIGLKVIVSELTGESSSVWAVNTSDLYTRKITYKGVEAFE